MTNRLALILVLIFSINSTLFPLSVPIPSNLKEKVGKFSCNPNERPSHAPVITGDSFRSLADWVVDETVTSIDTSNIKKGDVIFVGMSYLKYFVDKVFPHIKYPIILITSNGSGTIKNQFNKFIFHPNLFAWFGRNIVRKHPKLNIIPLGGKWFNSASYYQILSDKLQSLSRDKFFQEKKYHTLWSGIRETHKSRIKMRDKILSKEFVTALDKKTEFGEYIQNISDSRFILSPRGYNIDCCRTWEALWAGSIPVVESHGIDNVYDGLPVIIVSDLSKISMNYLNSEFQKLKQKKFNLEKLQMSYWESQVRLTQQRCRVNSKKAS